MGQLGETVQGGARVPRCVWCGGPARPAGGRLAVCAGCGAASTFPPPDDAELERAYAGAYRPASGRFAAGGDRLLRRTRATLARRLDLRAPPGPILDVGCGDGALLCALQARGRRALGLERDADLARASSAVRPIELLDFHELEGQWAAVVFWHSLEHLRAPRAALRHACRLLAPGGLLVVAMPNRSSWQARCLGERWLALDLPRHLVHLPAATLRAGVEECGLRIERVSHWRGGQVVFGWLHGLVAALPGGPDLYDAIRRPEARAAPMGARRRALALSAGLALAPLAGALAAAEVAAGAGGSVYLEARRPARARD